MPGIVGLITTASRPAAEAQLMRMVEAIRHEPCYVTGTWIDESLGVYVGWTARKGSFADAMPLCNESGDVVLVFSGEEYPDPGTAHQLKRRGHSLEEKGPAYLVHLAEEDSSFPAGLNGRFHGILTNRASRSTTLFNDRYGIHRVYYHESREGFHFAGEAKAILAVRPELRRLNPGSLGEFVACGCVLENRTLFEGVQILPPASSWTFRERAPVRKAVYFHPKEWQAQDSLQPEPYYHELRAVFSRNLPRYFNGQEPVGMSLTGGLDTRMIMAWQKAPWGTLPCYSFGGMYRDCEDVRVARKVAAVCGQPHQVLPVGQEFLSHFPEYAERSVYLSDACASVKHASDLYANQCAARIAPVRMTGNYGGEILRRLVAFKPVEPAEGLFRPELLDYVHAAQRTYTRLLAEPAASFIAFRQLPWYHYGLLVLEQTQVSVRSPFLDNDVVRTAFRTPDGARATSDIFADADDCVRLIAEGNPALARIRTDRGLAGRPGGGSIVARSLKEFTFKAEYAYDYGMPQWMARSDHLLSGLHLERLFLGRHKFNHFRVWYRDVLAQYVREMLLDSRTLSRSYLDRSRVESVVHGHLTGNRNYTTEIHLLLTLELAHRIFVDSQ